MLDNIRKSFRQEEGATAVEYGIMVALIAAVIVLIVLALGGQVKEGFCSVNSGMAEGSIGAVSGEC